jgi:hypothetical protein
VRTRSLLLAVIEHSSYTNAETPSRCCARLLRPARDEQRTGRGDQRPTRTLERYGPGYRNLGHYLLRALLDTGEYRPFLHSRLRRAPILVGMTEDDLIEPIHPGEVLMEDFIEGFSITQH